jgi:threonine dehydratase
VDAGGCPVSSHPHAPWPIGKADVLEARRRLTPYLQPTPLRRYAPLDRAVGHGISVFVKHENHNPTNSFKVRNAISAMSALSNDALRRGVVGATRGNHGLGLAYAGSLLRAPVTVCVPLHNNPEKNEAMRGLGALVIEEGRDYDESVSVADRLVAERGLTLVHSTNNREILAGAATLSFEILEEAPEVDGFVVAVGGGSQAVGALTAGRALRQDLVVFGVQAAGAPAAYDSWHAGRILATASADTFADGLATRSAYAMTFPTLLEGLAGFVIVSEAELGHAVRLLLSATHNLAEGAGAAGLAGLIKLGSRLAGKKVAIILSGGNMDATTLRRIMDGEI